MKSHMNWIKNSIIIIFISCLGGVLLIEGILQLMKGKDDWKIISKANILRNFEFQYDISNLYKSKVSSVSYVRDEFGLRDNCYEIEDIDILTIGGSTTDQRYVQFESTYQTVLQEKLRSKNLNFRCVTNAGIDGHSTWGHIFAFEHWFPLIPNLSPKFVLLYVGINDAGLDRIDSPKYIKIAKNNSRSIKGFLKQFEIAQRLLPIYRYLQSNKNSSVEYAGHKPNKYTINDYSITKLNDETVALSQRNATAFKSRLETILHYAENLGATMICVTQPHRYVMEKNGILYGVPDVLGKGFSGLDYDYSIREINLVIGNLCGENTLDLYNYEFSDDHFYDGIHTTAQGSEVIGNAMAKFIIERY